MSKAIKRRKKKSVAKGRTKNPRKRTGRTAKPRKAKPTSTAKPRRPTTPRRSKRTANDLMRSARSLLEIELGKAEGKVLEARNKTQRKKAGKKVSELKGQIRRLINK